MKTRWMAAVAALAVCISLSGCKKAENGMTKANDQPQETHQEETEAEPETEGTKSGDLDKDEAEETESETAGEYIFPESSSRLLTRDELKTLSGEQLRFARNEIFARHGRMFASADLQEYFDAKEWYEGNVKPEEFSDSVLNEIEKANISLIQAREALGEIGDGAGVYKKIMDEYQNQLFGWNGLLEYGHIEVAMSGSYREWYPELIDRGGYYEAREQVLSVPVYYSWEFIQKVKPGDKLTLSFGMNTDRQEYTVTDILQEHGREARVISVYAPGQNDKRELVFTDAFDMGKYVLAVVDWIEGDSYFIWNSDDISCACDILYQGSFYLAKDCVIDVAGELKSVEDQWAQDLENNPFGGAVYGDILEVDEDGLITKIRQQVAG